MDRVSREQRSANMARVRSRDTAPELAVRRAAHARGLRFRLHRRDLPGTPDIVFPRARLAVFVHGCFWHRHEECRRASVPETRATFWQCKFDRNVERDSENASALERLGWRVETIWECETRDAARLQGWLDASFPERRSFRQALP